MEVEGFTGGGERGGVRCGVGDGEAAPVEKLAVGGIAEVVIGVAMAQVEGVGADGDGEGFEGFGGVGGAGFAGRHLLDVGFDGKGRCEDELTVAGGDGERVMESQGFAVSGEDDSAEDEESGLWGRCGAGEGVDLRAESEGAGERLGGAGCTGAKGCAAGW